VPYELFEKLATLSSVLSNTERDNTTNAIRAEIKEIKKVGPQVMVQVAQDTLDRLRHSAQLIQDIEDLDRIMGRNLSVYSKDPKLQKVAKLIDGLSPLLKQAKEEEEKRKKDLSDKSNKANNRVEFTQQALLSYSSAVVTKAPLPEGYTNMKARLKEMSRLFRKEDKKAAGRGR